MTNDDKLLYRFSVTRKVEKTVEETSTDEGGAEITKKTKKTVDEPINIVVKKPTRKQEDDAEEEYAIQYSRMVRKGLVSKAILLDQANGVMAESDIKELKRLGKELEDVRDEYIKTGAFSSTKKKDSKLKELSDKNTSLATEILALENKYRSIFENTAESKAEIKRLMWMRLNLSFKEDGENLLPIYEGNTTEEKRESYYKLEEASDEVYSQIAAKLSLVWAILQYNWNATKEEIDEILKRVESGE